MAENTVNPLSSWQRLGEWLTRSAHSDPAGARRGRLLAAVALVIELLSLVIAALVYGAGVGHVASTALIQALPIGVGMNLLWLVIFVLNRRGRTSLAGTLFALQLLGTDAALLAAVGPLSPNALTLTIPIIIAGFFGAPLSAIGIAVLTVAVYFGLNVNADAAYVANIGKGGPAAQTLIVYANISFIAIVGWLFSRTTRQTLQESRELSLALVAQRQDLAQHIETQSRQLQATTSVARAIAGSRNMNKLLEDIVRLVRETFGFYHVQIFLVDDETSYAVLRQSTGDTGQTLLERGYRLPVGSLSMIGQVTATGRPAIIRDTDSDFVSKSNELLPQTRSEMALPLSIGDKIIGALDMQSAEPNAFADENLATFQALADQLAIAIENARLFEQAEDSLRVMRELNREVTERSWAEFLSEAQESEKHFAEGPETKAIEIHRSRVIERVLTSGGTIVSTGKDGRQAFIAAPIVVRNEIVGVIGIEPDGLREWSQDDLTLIQSIAERTALAVENARLYIQAQRAAEREILINSIASRLQRAPSLAMLLESAARELSDALGTSNVYAEINMDQPLGETRKDVAESEQAAKNEENENVPESDKSGEARA